MQAPHASLRTYAGLFFVTLSTLMFEILLTRIFSVTMWYHSAFVAISMALFGMTAGAIVAYLLPQVFTPEKAKPQLALTALLFSLAIVGSFLTHLSVPFGVDASIPGLWATALTYVVITVPFFFSGLCVSLALTRFPASVSRLYAVDLAGAALGCVLLVQLLDWTDGPTAVFAVAGLAALGALAFSLDGAGWKTRGWAIAVTVFLALFVLGHTRLAANQHSLLRVRFVKGGVETPATFEKWNSFSRVRIDGDEKSTQPPAGWGLSPLYPTDRRVRQMLLTIDGNAATVLTAFDGDLAPLDHLKHDVTNIAHHLRRDAKVLVVGAGGGRDVLSALAFEQKSVTGVEINPAIGEAVNGRFGDYTGHLDRHPKVRLVYDEARSFIAGTQETFDLLQISLIDTWAATASGAFVFAENTLYTLEAWRSFFEHLTPTGVLTVSRWYFKDRPAEIYRTVVLARSALREVGITDARRHILVVRCQPPPVPGGVPDGVGTVMVSRSPFTDADVATLQEVAGRMGFDVVLAPGVAGESTLEAITAAPDLAAFARAFPLDISVTTDDKPFFFHMLRVRDILSPEVNELAATSFNMKAILVLTVLVIIVFGLTYLCIAIPLKRTVRRESLKGSLPFMLYFGAIGLAFMLVEVSQMQKFILYLGHPTRGLSVVLTALLVASGLGSFLTEGLGSPRRGRIRLAVLVGLLLVFGLASGPILTATRGLATSARMGLAAALLAPLGLFMGMAFPMGMKLAAPRFSHLTPWLWGINGATSVCASVLAIVFALSFGISSSFWIGVVLYGGALAAYHFGARANERAPQ